MDHKSPPDIQESADTDAQGIRDATVAGAWPFGPGGELLDAAYAPRVLNSRQGEEEAERRARVTLVVDSRSEFYWHHGDARVGCARFGKSYGLGAPPREGTAVATYNERELARQREADGTR